MSLNSRFDDKLCDNLTNFLISLSIRCETMLIRNICHYMTGITTDCLTSFPTSCWLQIKGVNHHIQFVLSRILRLSVIGLQLMCPKYPQLLSLLFSLHVPDDTAYIAACRLVGYPTLTA